MVVNKEENIVKGYKGIMDLDLNLMPEQFWKDAIEQHEKDIKEYKIEQKKRPERLRYENTVVKANKLHEIDSAAAQKRKEMKMEEQEKRIYNKRNSKIKK